MRLIDADKLIDYFYYGIDDKPIIDGISDRKIINIIKNQTTAYSVDKVVEKLEERQKEYLAGFGVHNNYEMYGVACGLGDAIKIVKQGGVGKDDVCEWKQHEKEIDVYFTECGQAHIFVDGNTEENNHVYCPYCGKKIKVVE